MADGRAYVQLGELLFTCVRYQLAHAKVIRSPPLLYMPVIQDQGLSGLSPTIFIVSAPAFDSSRKKKQTSARAYTTWEGIYCLKH